MAKYQTLERKNYLIPYYIKFCFLSLILRHFAPFDWKFLQIGTQRAKELRKNGLILQKGASPHFPHRQPVIRVVLLQKRSNALRLLQPHCTYFYLMGKMVFTYNIFVKINPLIWSKWNTSFFPTVWILNSNLAGSLVYEKCLKISSKE